MNENLKIITSLAEMKEYIGNSKVIAFSIQTSPFDEHRSIPNASLDAHMADIVGISFSVAEGSAVYVPLKHRLGANTKDINGIWNYLKELFTDKTIIKVAHDLCFVAKFLCSRNIIIKAPVYDTLVAKMMTMKSEMEFNKLEECELKQIYPNIEMLEEGISDKLFDEFNANDTAALLYACTISDCTFKLYNECNEWFDENLPAHRKIVEDIESPTAVYCGLMAYNGIPVDIEKTKEKAEIVQKELDELKKKIDKYTFGIDIGEMGVSEELIHFIKYTLKLPLNRKTDLGKPQLDGAAIKELKIYCKNNKKPDVIPFLDLLLKFRKAAYINSHYLEAFLASYSEVTKCIHPTLLQLGAETGRFSSKEPNMQNLPRIENDESRIRDLIIAPPNCVLLSVDFSQIELRVGAYYCRDKKLMNAYRNNADIHSQTAEIIFGIEEEASDSKHSSDHRSIAKACNFGVLYGLFPKGLHERLKYNANIEDITVERCEKIIKKLKEGYPRITKWQSKTKKLIHSQKYIDTKAGRRRYLPNIDSYKKKDMYKAERQALNTPIQGTAADILKMAMSRIVNEIEDKPWLKPILQVHDELVFVVDEKHIDEAVNFVKEAMEVKPFEDFDIPLKADPEIGNTFGSLVKYTKE